MSAKAQRRRRKRERRNPPWTPLRQTTFDPVQRARAQQVADSVGHEYEMPDEVWGNDLYTVTVRYEEGDRDGLLVVGVHRHDREPVHDWRHFQQIKNEVAGATRTAVEVYPSEEHLIDTSNEYWLWVMPASFELPFGFKTGTAVLEDDDLRDQDARAGVRTRSRQRPWQAGLTTGRHGQREATLALISDRTEGGRL